MQRKTKNISTFPDSILDMTINKYFVKLSRHTNASLSKTNLTRVAWNKEEKPSTDT